MLLEAIVRRFPALRALTEATTGGRLTGTLSLAVAQVEAEFQEMTRSGRRFASICGTAGVAPVQAVPTTAAAWGLYNADINKAYVIDQITFFILSGTPVTGGTILAIVSQITATLPTLAAGATVANMSLGGLASKAIPNTGYTLPSPTGAQQWVVAPGQGGQVSAGTPTASVGGNYTADIRGRMIVPPGRILGMSMLAGAGTTPLYIPCVTWHEVDLDLE